MSDDLCAVVEGVVYGDDPKITPLDRLVLAAEIARRRVRDAR